MGGGWGIELNIIFISSNIVKIIISFQLLLCMFIIYIFSEFLKKLFHDFMFGKDEKKSIRGCFSVINTFLILLSVHFYL